MTAEKNGISRLLNNITSSSEMMNVERERNMIGSWRKHNYAITTPTCLNNPIPCAQKLL